MNSTHSLEEPSQLTAQRLQDPTTATAAAAQAKKRRQTLPLYNDNEQQSVHKYKDRFSFLRNSKFLQDLENDSVDSELIEEELSALQQVSIGTRDRVAKFLQSNPVQILLCVIVLLDAGIVIAQILLDLNSVKEKLHRRDFQLSSLLRYIKETEAEKLHGYEGGDIDLILRMLHDPTTVKDTTANRTGNMTAARGHHRPRPHDAQAPAPASAAAAADQDAASTVNGLHLVEQGENDLLHEVAHGLHFASIALLGFLVVEDLIKIIAMGRTFFKHKIEIFDAVIIVSSFAIDIVFLGGVSGEEGQKAAAVLVILLLWRIARVVDGIVVTVKQRQEFRIRLQKRARRMAEKKLESFEEERHAKTRQIEALKDLCAKAGITDADIAACSPIDPKRVNTTLSALSSVARLSVSMTMLMSSGVYRPRLLNERFILPKLLNPRAKGPSPQRRSGGGGVLPRIESLPIMRNNSCASSAAKKHRRNRKSLSGKIGKKNGNGGIGATDMTTIVKEECSHVTIESTTSSCASGPEVEELNGGRETKEEEVNDDNDQWPESPINTSGILIVVEGVSDDETQLQETRQRQEEEEEEVEEDFSSGHTTPSAVTPDDPLPDHSGCFGSDPKIQIRPHENPDCSVDIERKMAVRFHRNKASAIEEEEEELSLSLSPTADDVTDGSSRDLEYTPTYEEEEEEEEESCPRSRCHGGRQTTMTTTTARRRPVKPSSSDGGGGGPAGAVDPSSASSMSFRLRFSQPSTDSSVNGMTPEEGVEEEEEESLPIAEDPCFPSAALSAGKSHQPSNSHSVMLSDT